MREFTRNFVVAHALVASLQWHSACHLREAGKFLGKSVCREGITYYLGIELVIWNRQGRGHR